MIHLRADVVGGHWHPAPDEVDLLGDLHLECGDIGVEIEFSELDQVRAWRAAVEEADLMLRAVTHPPSAAGFDARGAQLGGAVVTLRVSASALRELAPPGEEDRSWGLFLDDPDSGVGALLSLGEEAVADVRRTLTEIEAAAP